MTTVDYFFRFDLIPYITCDQI